MTRLQTVTGAAIVTAWIITVTKGVLTRDYTGLDLTTPVMLIYAGFVFGDVVLRRRYEPRNGDDG